MRSSLLIVLFCLLTIGSDAQHSKIKRLKSDLDRSKNDTVRFYKLDSLAITFLEFNDSDTIKKYIDSSLYYANRAYFIARKLNDPLLKAIGLRGSSYAYQVSGNLPKALEIELQVLKLYESIKDTIGMAFTYDNIGAIYDDLDEIHLSINYQKKTYELYDKINFIPLKLEAASHLGYAYTLLNMPDSALPFFHEANTIITKGSKEDISLTLPFALYGLGKVNYQYGNYSIALPYYKKAYELSKKVSYFPGAWYKFVISIGMAEVYAKMGNTSEAIQHYKNAIQLQSNDKLTPSVYIALSNLYKNIDLGLAYDYLNKGMQLRDSLFTEKNRIAIQNLTNAEKDRQRELKEEMALQEVERGRNIQFMAIGVCIISFIILFLLLSNTILVKPRVIKLLGIVGLLITFEFINLLIHPFLERITHHSPFLMLICLAILASLIVPLHHWLEKWVTTKVVEKNENYRINVAKRILDESKNRNN